MVSGPSLSLRYPVADDAPRLFELASDPAVTRWFSWGPYTEVAQAAGWIAAQPAKREAGEIMDFLIVDPSAGALGVTGLTEIAQRDRRATVGSWLGQPYWGSGANFEAKAMIAALAFRRLGVERLTAWANTRNGRSQRALERVGFRREGVLARVAPARRRDARRRRVRASAGCVGAERPGRGSRAHRGHPAARVHRGLTRGCAAWRARR